MEQLWNFPGRFWRWLRAVSGDDAYERYLAHYVSCHPDVAPLDRKAFFLRAQQRKWAKINRCC